MSNLPNITLDIWVLQAFPLARASELGSLPELPCPFARSSHRLPDDEEVGGRPRFRYLKPRREPFPTMEPAAGVGAFESRMDAWIVAPQGPPMLVTRIRMSVSAGILTRPSELLSYANGLLTSAGRPSYRQELGGSFGLRHDELVCACDYSQLRGWGSPGPSAENIGAGGQYDAVAHRDGVVCVARLKSWPNSQSSDLWVCDPITDPVRPERSMIDANGVVTIAIRLFLYRAIHSMVRDRYLWYATALEGTHRAALDRRAGLIEASRCFQMATEQYSWSGMTMYEDIDEPIIDSIAERIGLRESVTEWNDRLDRIFHLAQLAAAEQELRYSRWGAVALVIVNIAAIVGTVAGVLQAADGDRQPNRNVGVILAVVLACAALTAGTWITLRLRSGQARR